MSIIVEKVCACTLKSTSFCLPVTWWNLSLVCSSLVSLQRWGGSSTLEGIVQKWWMLWVLAGYKWESNIDQELILALINSPALIHESVSPFTWHYGESPACNTSLHFISSSRYSFNLFCHLIVLAWSSYNFMLHPCM